MQEIKKDLSELIHHSTTASVVGNGKITGNFGEEIGRWPTYRFNNAPTEGYEGKVGSRTDFRFINPTLQKGESLSCLKLPENWIGCLTGETLICKPTGEDVFAEEAKRIAGTDNTIVRLSPQLYNTCALDFGIEHPTSGLFAIWLLRFFYEEVFAYGFDAYQKSGHYWEDVFQERLEHSHNMKLELDFLRNCNGVILRNE